MLKFDSTTPAISEEKITLTFIRGGWTATSDFTLTVRALSCTVAPDPSAPAELHYEIGDDLLDIVLEEYFLVSDGCS